MAAGLDLLYLEQVLTEMGIEVIFDPYRPGEEIYTRGVVPPIRMMVKARDLAQAREVQSDLLSAPPVDADQEIDPELLETNDAEAEWREPPAPRPAKGPPPMPEPTRPTAGCLGGLLMVIGALGALAMFL